MADGGARWSLMRVPAVWLPDGQPRLPQVGQVLFTGRADVWLYGANLSGHIWATRNGGKS